MADDLVQFLRDRYDEDERQARAAMTYAAADWFIETSGIVTTGPDGDAYTDDREVAEHMARHDPARILTEVEAKRCLLDVHAITVEKIDAPRFDPQTGERRPDDEYDITCEACGWADNDPTSGCQTLRLLAAVYADHPDYREGWRP